ncbi:MAG TPA: MBL fold metallo-hydrolase, partial [Anaerolineae bacterium]
ESMIEVLFLGVSAAVPMPGQTNASCILRSGKTCILIDCGPAILQQLAAVGLSPAEITHLYFTHRHGDHALGFPMLMLWWSVTGQQELSLPTIVGSEQTLKSLDEMVYLAFGADTASVVAPAPHITLPQTGSTVQLTPEFRLQAIPMRHHAYAPVMGARFEVDGHAFAFTGDTMPTDAIITLAHDADLLVHDATFSATLNPEHAQGAFGHSTAQIAARNAAAANVKHLALIHIDARYQGKESIFLEEARREFTGQVSIPTGGTLFTF